ncbi:hypothetical protein [Chlamydia felis Fe/C-56]|uniref:Uncharacterized protein n=1 Tax=Chlamydia felis (strain Fe/C-56) TaxID=264202 RepID=Q255Y8_CHLFF|nr:hypothetical protein [Chlamydia felis Fe/C-56]
MQHILVQFFHFTIFRFLIFCPTMLSEPEKSLLNFFEKFFFFLFLDANAFALNSNINPLNFYPLPINLKFAPKLLPGKKKFILLLKNSYFKNAE